MKKAFALVLALMMVLSMGTIAFAEEDAAVETNAVEDALADIVDFSEGLNLDTDIFKTIEDAAVSALESVSNLDLTKFNSDSIANIIDGFKDVLADIGIDTSSSTLKELFNNLKQKIKDLYCGAEAEIPAEEEAPDTGSSATGIVAFAAVSVAAAAAYVCTKKKVA